MGIAIRYYDPRAGEGISKLLSANTKAVFIETPGSLTFEIQDLPGIAAGVAGKDIIILADNSWATPLYYRPLELGADIVVHAGTKMFVGHSDVMIGTISANERVWPRIKQMHYRMGICASPDDAYLTARGLRTLAIRMKTQGEASTELAEWLETQPGVARVLHPALPSHPDHALYARDFSGSGSLFSFLLEPGPREALAAMVDGMDLFGMGYSWGGYESLILPADPTQIRTAVPWDETGHLVRIHVGLEALDDLKADLAAGLERYCAAI
jgi:cystathionine beta-lyase